MNEGSTKVNKDQRLSILPPSSYLPVTRMLGDGAKKISKINPKLTQQIVLEDWTGSEPASEYPLIAGRNKQ